MRGRFVMRGAGRCHLGGAEAERSIESRRQLNQSNRASADRELVIRLWVDAG